MKLAICHFGHAFDKLEVGVYVCSRSRAASYRRVRSLMGNSVNLVKGLIVLITVFCLKKLGQLETMIQAQILQEFFFVHFASKIGLKM